MNKNDTTANTFWVGIIWFIFGLAVGLVVLGWWLWPVNWVGGTFSTLQPVYQQEYLRAVIDSYSFNSDSELAQKRFMAIGENKYALLRQLYQSPDPITLQEVKHFSTAIGADYALDGNIQPITAQPISSIPLSWLSGLPGWLRINLAALLGLLLLLLIILLAFRSRRRNKRNTAELPAIRTFDTPAKPTTEPAATSLLDFETPNSEAGHIEMPDWLEDSRQEFTSTPSRDTNNGIDLELSDEDFNDLTPEEAAEFRIETDAEAQPDQVLQNRNSQGETAEQTYEKFTRGLESIPGLSEVEAQLLKTAGVGVPLLLLKQGSTMEGRGAISDHTGIDGTKILEWVNLINLLRVPELNWEDLKALSSTGVKNIQDLAGKETDSLVLSIQNTARDIDPYYILPSREMVALWIEQAIMLPGAIQ